MTKEDKQLLLKDLCARLPYGVNVNIINDGYEAFQEGAYDNTLRYHHIEPFVCDRIEIYPYLRPMSSMTEAEKFILQSFVTDACLDIDKFDEYIYIANPTQLDWLNEHHFDYRELIPMGLALEAPEDMYKTK